MVRMGGVWLVMTGDVVFVRRRLDNTTSIPSMSRQTTNRANPRLVRLWRDSFRGHAVTPSVTITSNHPDHHSTNRDLVSRLVRFDADRGGPKGPTRESRHSLAGAEDDVQIANGVFRRLCFSTTRRRRTNTTSTDISTTPRPPSSKATASSRATRGWVVRL
jgi:hypothetical protein